jgi:hypothetical protein
MVVAINRNAWSRSFGIGGRNHSVRADLFVEGNVLFGRIDVNVIAQTIK